LHPPGRLAGGLNGRQQEGNEHRDDCDDDQELDEREAASLSTGPHGTSPFLKNFRQAGGTRTDLIGIRF
jgi:hypothetical protein